MPESCADKRALIHAALDDDLSPAARAELWRHFAACPACRATYERLERATATLAAAPAFEPSSDFAARVMLRVRYERAAAVQRLRTRAGMITAFAGGIAAALVAVWSGVVAPTASAFALELGKTALTILTHGGYVLKAAAIAIAPLWKVAGALAETAVTWTWHRLLAASPAYGAALAGAFLLFAIWRARRPAAAAAPRTFSI